MIEIKERLKKLNDTLKERLGARNSLLKQSEEFSVEISNREEYEFLIDKVIALFNSIGDAQRQVLKEKIDEVVTYGIQTVFSENCDFSIVLGEQRGYPVMNFRLLKNGKERMILGGDGGGLVDLCGYLMQILFIVLMRGKIRNLIWFDEAFAHLSEGYRDKLCDLKQELCDKLDFQEVFITQQREYVNLGDVAYEVSLDENGHSQFERIK